MSASEAAAMSAPGVDVAAAVETIAALLAPEFETLLVLGYGSYFQGGFGPRSDIDLIWLTRSASHEKRPFPIGGRVFEVTHLGLKRFVSAIDEGHAVYVPAGACGTVLAGASGVVDLVRQKALARMQAGPLSVEALDGWRRRIETLWADVLDAGADDVLFVMLQTHLLNALYEYACADHKRWKRGLKHLFADMDSCRPGLGDGFRSALAGGSISERLDATGLLLRTVIGGH
jgi:hypothetical protein